jgi:hypothetical protein
MIIFGEAMLRRALHEFNEHEGSERPHQGIGNVLIEGSKQAKGQGKVERQECLGGLLEKYRRSAWAEEPR